MYTQLLLIDGTQLSAAAVAKLLCLQESQSPAACYFHLESNTMQLQKVMAICRKEQPAAYKMQLQQLCVDVSSMRDCTECAFTCRRTTPSMLK
jgi:hypothetical protein